MPDLPVVLPQPHGPLIDVAFVDAMATGLGGGVRQREQPASVLPSR